MKSHFSLVPLILLIFCKNSQANCIKLDVSFMQKLEFEGFHRNINWLIETSSPSKDEWVHSQCRLMVRVVVSNEMYVNPDEIAELNRTKELKIAIDGEVDVEAPAHEASEHVVYIFLDQEDFERKSIKLPIHIRYQRAKIIGRYGKVNYYKPSLLGWCPDKTRFCGSGLKVEAPCSFFNRKICVWKNISYNALFEEVELYVAIGDLDDYPLVSIVTLLLGCAGCIYIMSLLTTKNL